MKLSPRQEAFIESYLLTGGDGTEAYIAAGYKVKNNLVARVCASRMLTKANILKALTARRTALRKAADVTAQEVIAVLASHMRGNILDLLDRYGDLDVQLVRERKLGHLIKAVNIRREKSEKRGRQIVEVSIVRLEVQSQQSAAVQLCKVLGIEQKKRTNENDPERLKVLLDEKVNFALEGFRRAGVNLKRQDIIEMYASAPASAGDLYPLIQEELASVH